MFVLFSGVTVQGKNRKQVLKVKFMRGLKQTTNKSMGQYLVAFNYNCTGI